MKRAVWLIGVVLAAGAAMPAHAQRISSLGIVDSVQPSTGMLAVRKAGALQSIQVAPSADLTINGRRATLGEIAYNADVSILGWRQIGGALVADVVRVTQPFVPTRLASAMPDSVINGEIVGILPGLNSVLLRTSTGIREVNLGTAPIFLNGRTVSLRQLALGDKFQMQRASPSPGLVPTPALAVVLTPQAVAGSRQIFHGPSGPLGGTPDLLPSGGATPAPAGGASPNSLGE